MPWRVEVPYDRNSPYMFGDSRDVAEFLTCNCDTYIDNYEYDSSSYDESLDCEGTVSVNGIDLWPSEILKELRPEYYNEGLDEERRYYARESGDNIEYELDHATRDTVWFDGGITCTYIDEEEIEDEDDEGLDKEEFSDCFSIG